MGGPFSLFVLTRTIPCTSLSCFSFRASSTTYLGTGEARTGFPRTGVSIVGLMGMGLWNLMAGFWSTLRPAGGSGFTATTRILEPDACCCCCCCCCCCLAFSWAWASRKSFRYSSGISSLSSSALRREAMSGSSPAGISKSENPSPESPLVFTVNSKL